MKILHVSRTMGQGGAEKIVYQLCRDRTRAVCHIMWWVLCRRIAKNRCKAFCNVGYRQKKSILNVGMSI